MTMRIFTASVIIAAVSLGTPAFVQAQGAPSQSEAQTPPAQSSTVIRRRAIGAARASARRNNPSRIEWQQHSVRGFLAGVVRKKLGLILTSKKTVKGRVYRITNV